MRANIEYLGRLFQAKTVDASKNRSIKRTVPPVPLQPMMPTTGATPLFTTSSTCFSFRQGAQVQSQSNIERVVGEGP